MKTISIFGPLLSLMIMLVVSGCNDNRKPDLENTGSSDKRPAPVFKDFISIEMEGKSSVTVALSDNLEVFSSFGLRSVGNEALAWQEVEASAASGFDWSVPDYVIAKAELNNGTVNTSLWSKSNWGTELDAARRTSSAPLDMERYRNFVRAFVERYDHDGINDMPDLRFSHNVIQIEDEAENLSSSWTVPACGNDYVCAGNRYGELLQAASTAAKEANPNAKIMSFSFNPGSQFDSNAVGTPLSAPELDFLNTVFDNYWEYFDIIAVQCNYDYTGLPQWLRFIEDTYNQTMPIAQRKPIVCADSATMPQLAKSAFHTERYVNDNLGSVSDAALRTILFNGVNDILFPEVKEWWEAEKARRSVKKAVVAASMGVEYIGLQYIAWAFTRQDGNVWAYSGLLGAGDPLDDDGPVGTPRAVVHAIGELIAIVGSFSEVQALDPIPAGADPLVYTWIYSMDKGTRFIAWNETSITANLSSFFATPNVRGTPIITQTCVPNTPVYVSTACNMVADFGAVPEATTVYPADQVPLSRTPLYIEVDP